MENLIVDPEFKNKIPPLTEEEFKQLEENILNDGEIREPIVVWNNTILDGHHRYAVVQKHPEIPFTVKRMEFSDRYAAVYWMCKNQLGRRNMTEWQMTAIREQAYEAQKMTRGSNNQFSRGKSEKIQNGFFHSDEESAKKNTNPTQHNPTQHKVASDFGVSAARIKHDRMAILGLEAMDEIEPGIKDAVINGVIPLNRQSAEDFRYVPEEHREEVLEDIKKGDTKSARKKMKEVIPPKGSRTTKETKPKNTEEKEEYNAEDVREILFLAVDQMDTAFNTEMVMNHSDILDTEEGRAAADEALTRAETVINNYREVLNTYYKEDKV